MRIKITGRNIELTDGIKDAVEDKLNKLEKYFTPDTDVYVTLSVEKERQKVEVTIPMKGNYIRSEQVSNDMYVSIDLVEEVIERQLKKYRTKLVTKQQSAASVFKQDFLDAASDDDEEIKIIVMTAFDEITYIPRARAAGANGFIYKSRSLHDFLEVARTVMAGGSSFPEPRTIPMPQGEAPLTDREMEVLRLMCRHMTNKEIAQELFISENPVKYHKMNMLGKTGFSKAVDLAFYMISNGWINPLY